MKHYVSKYAQCPFYHKEDQRKLFCEGVEKGTAIQLSFDTNVHHKDYKQELCCSPNWKDCRIAKMLEEKYGEN